MPQPDTPQENSEATFTGQVLLTVADLAHLLKVATRTVWRLNSAGKLPKPITFGGSVRWKLDDVLAWIKAGCPLAE